MGVGELDALVGKSVDVGGADIFRSVAFEVAVTEVSARMMITLGCSLLLTLSDREFFCDLALIAPGRHNIGVSSAAAVAMRLLSDLLIINLEI